MKTFFREIFGRKMAFHRRHSDLLHNAGTALGKVHRGRVMFVLGGLALAAEMLRRRRHSTQQLPQFTES